MENDGLVDITHMTADFQYGNVANVRKGKQIVIPFGENFHLRLTERTLTMRCNTIERKLQYGFCFATGLLGETKVFPWEEEVQLAEVEALIYGLKFKEEYHPRHLFLSDRINIGVQYNLLCSQKAEMSIIVCIVIRDAIAVFLCRYWMDAYMFVQQELCEHTVEHNIKKVAVMQRKKLAALKKRALKK